MLPCGAGRPGGAYAGSSFCKIGPKARLIGSVCAASPKRALMQSMPLSLCLNALTGEAVMPDYLAFGLRPSPIFLAVAARRLL